MQSHTDPVHLGSGPSWELRISDPDDLFFALYVRDACGLTTAADTPPLSPDIAGMSAAAPAGLATQWEAWWSALLEDRARGAAWYSAFVTEEFDWRATGAGTADLLPAGKELRQAQQALLRAARKWRSVHPFERRRAPHLVPQEVSLLETHLVKDIESTLGRKARPFSYVVEAVPVQGEWCLDLSSTALLVSEELLTDSDSYREVLRPRLTALA